MTPTIRHRNRLASRRPALLISAAGVTALGLGLHFLAVGELANWITDALYTVLVYLVLALLLPGAKRHWIAASAFAASALIELAQLSNIPAQLAVTFPPSRLIFGTTFSATDLLAYAVGALAVYGADTLISRRGAAWDASRTE